MSSFARTYINLSILFKRQRPEAVDKGPTFDNLLVKEANSCYDHIAAEELQSCWH